MDIRKTLLWVVFSVSGIMLFNNYQISNGQNPLPLFAPPQATNPNTSNTPKQESANTNLSSVPQVIDQKVKVDAPTNAVDSSQNTPSKTLFLKNDLLEVEISNKGGTITHAILKKHTENKQPIVLFNTEKQSTYLARSGLTSVGLELPNHNDIFLDKVIQN